MTAPHDRHDRRDGYDRRDGDDSVLPVDPLMTVVAGEPLTDAQRADAAFMAGHREAVADVAALREQLGLIADALTRPVAAEEPAPQPLPEPRQVPVLARRRPRRRVAVAFGSLAVAAVAAVLSGTAWLLAQAGGSDSSAVSSSADDAAGAKEAQRGAGSDSSSSYLACARLVVEGDVTAVRPDKGASGRYRVTLHITRAYKPADIPADQVTVVADASADPAPRTGLHVLVGVTGPSATTVPDLWVTGEERIAEQRALLRQESGHPLTPAPGCS
jgi:hypothetical protein